MVAGVSLREEVKDSKLTRMVELDSSVVALLRRAMRRWDRSVGDEVEAGVCAGVDERPKSVRRRATANNSKKRFINASTPKTLMI